MNNITTNAHKVAFALSKKLGESIKVSRMPLTKTTMAFEFRTPERAATFGQSFVETNLAAFATRLMTELIGNRDDTKKGNVSRKG